MKKRTSYGGMTKCIELNKAKLEKHYRHIFKSDEYVIKLLEEFSLLDKLQWKKTKMAYYSKEGLYEFGTPMSLLKYKPLNFFQKLLFGVSIIKIKLINSYIKIEKYTAEQWIIKNCGEKVYRKIWEPLLITKFGKQKDKVSMAWLWGKIKLRGSSSKASGEELGYLDGSFEILTQEIERYLLENKCDIKLNTKIDKIIKKNDKYIINKEDSTEQYDYIISTVSYNVSKEIFNDLLDNEEKKKMQDLKYTCAKTLLLVTKKSLSPFYWINIGDTDIPFGGIIEHTNMINKSNYSDNHIIYISNYMSDKDRLYNLNANELLCEYLPHLKRLNKKLKKEDVIDLYCFEEDDAQPVITTNYSKKILNIKLKEKGLFIANMAQIYPEDRGMNYAIKLGYEVANYILMQQKRRKR